MIDFLQSIATTIATTTIGVTVGTYVGMKIAKREIKGEITNYLINELPHLLQNKQLQFRVRQLAHIFFDELINFILAEEEGSGQKSGEDRKEHRSRAGDRSKP